MGILNKRISWMGLAVCCLMSLLVFTSCSETDEEQEEYVYVERTLNDSTVYDWKTGNDKAFEDTLKYAKQQIANGDTSWKVILNWSFDHQQANGSGTTLSYGNDRYIVMHMLEEGKGTTNPAYSDSVYVNYRGRLLPSRTYKNGYVFDQSYKGQLDSRYSSPSEFKVSALVDGFTTALMNMHEGDRCMVYIPYYLAYGSNSTTSIPAYSMLRFDIHLARIVKK